MITNGTVQLINVGRCAEAFPRQAAALKGNQLSMIGTVITIDIHIHIYTYITLHLSNTVCIYIYIYIYIYTYIYTYVRDYTHALSSLVTAIAKRSETKIARQDRGDADIYH